jgi:hypothetical protein
MPTQYPKEFKLKTVARYEHGENHPRHMSGHPYFSGHALPMDKGIPFYPYATTNYTPAELDALQGNRKNWNIF